MTSRLRPGLPAAVAGLVVVAAGLVFTRALGTRTNYDEGVYLASLDALRRGQELGGEVYTSQPPAFYWVLRVLASPFGTSIEGIRVGFALLALVGVAAAIAFGWSLYGPAAGIAAGAFLAIGPPYPTVAPTVAADVPAVALGLVSLALLSLALKAGRSGVSDTRTTSSRLRHGARAGVRHRQACMNVAAGAVYAAAVLTKLLALPFAVPLVALALAARAGRRVLPAAAAGAAFVVIVLVLVHAGSLGAIWDAVVGDHADAKELGSFADNARWIRDHLEPRTPIAWLVPAGFVAFLGSHRARSVWPLWTFVPAAALFLLLVRPLADHHLLLLSAAYAVAAGPSLALAVAGLQRPLRVGATGLVCVLVAAGLYQEQRRLHRNDMPEPAEVTWAVAAVRAVTVPEAVVVSDQPIVVFRAHRETPGSLVDTSNTRIAGGGLTGGEILAEIDRAHPAAVLADRMFRTLPDVLAGLDRRYPDAIPCGEATLYLPGRPRTALPECRL